MSLKFAAQDRSAVDLHVVSAEALPNWIAGQDGDVASWVETMG